MKNEHPHFLFIFYEKLRLRDSVTCSFQIREKHNQIYTHKHHLGSNVANGPEGTQNKAETQVRRLFKAGPRHS